MKIRFQITKEEQIRFISHLDYTRTLERALHRAKFPMAYSEGFNPHMKFSFASALAVGTVSAAEYMDIELTKPLAVAAAAAAFNAALPQGISLVAAKEIKIPCSALMAVVNLATYKIVLSLTAAATMEQVQAALDAFVEEPIVFYTKQKAKGPAKEIDLKEFIAEKPGVEVQGNKLTLELALHIKPTGSVKPEDVISVLRKQYGLPVEENQAIVNRTGLFVLRQGQKLTPLDL